MNTDTLQPVTLSSACSISVAAGTILPIKTSWRHQSLAKNNNNRVNNDKENEGKLVRGKLHRS